MDVPTTILTDPTHRFVTFVVLVILALLLFFLWSAPRKEDSSHNKPHENLTTAEEERLERQQRAAAAAFVRQQQQQRERERSKAQHRPRRKTVSQDETAEKHESAPNSIRQASLGDQVAWKEERASQEQFGGFSIYGHTADDFCCCAPAASSSRRQIIAPCLPTGFHAIQGVSEIPHKPDSATARDTLLRLCREFEPVVAARGWTVQNLVELCTCRDPTKAINVAGYCVSRSDNRTAHSIHLRLRTRCGHRGAAQVAYSSLVKTMAHELAHIAIGPHNDAFFRLMAEIEQEYAEAMLRGKGGSDDDGLFFPLTEGRRLGTLDGTVPILGSKELKASVANAAVKRFLNAKQKEHAD